MLGNFTVGKMTAGRQLFADGCWETGLLLDMIVGWRDCWETGIEGDRTGGKQD